MSSDAEDLVAFLHEKNKPEIRKAAAGIIVGLTASADGIQQLTPVQVPLLTALLRLVPCSEPDAAALSRTALTCLVNLAQDQRWAGVLLGRAVVGRLMEFIRDKACPHMELLLMLLVNVTVLDKGCEDLLQLDRPGLEGLHMAVLLKAFVTSAVTLLPGQPDPYQHIAALLTNTTRLQQGRQLLLQPGRGFLQALAAQLQPGCSLQRRRGCAGALRNVAISAEADGTLTELLSDEAVLQRLLAPLGGGSAAAAAAAANGQQQQQQNGSADPATAAAAVNGVQEHLGGLTLGSNGSSAGVGAAASAAVAGSTGSSNSSWRDPDDGVREALAEAISVLAATDAGRQALWKVSAPEQLRKAYEDESHPEVCRAMEAAARSFMFDTDGHALKVEREEEVQGGQEGGAVQAGAAV